MIPCRILLFSLVLFAAVSCLSPGDTHSSGWESYGGNSARTHYSPLSQIDTGNVSRLQVAWQYHTGDAEPMTQIQVNPINIGGILYGVSPKLKLFALDAATGKEKWVFDPVKDQAAAGRGYFQMNVCRGVAYYRGSDSDQRIFYSASSRLYCIDARSGKPIASFGDSGRIDLHQDLGRDVRNLYVASTTPGIIYKDIIIIGTRVAEEADAAPGHIRAYDVHTGKLRWIFHTIPQPGEPGYESWDNPEAWKHIGGANVWAGFSLDEQHGMVFAPVGSASYDFYGGKRTGNDLYANCVLALDALTGKRIWHFQTVHHDLWDRDLPTAPVLVDVNQDGRKVEALAQLSKSGFIFLLDRHTGRPLYPVVETPVPRETELVGEKPAPTQPVPSWPLPIVRQSLDQQDLNHLVADSSLQKIKKQLSAYRHDHMFSPPSREGTVIFPGFDGGAEWGGPAYDPATGILYVNASEMPWILTMVDKSIKPAGSENNLEAGKRLYQAHCMSCHGPALQGGGNYPTLIGVGKKYNSEQFIQLVTSGRRMMPGFGSLSAGEQKALASYILELSASQRDKFTGPPKSPDEWLDLPYGATGYNKFLTPEGYPAVAPPWGTLSAINLHTGQLVWKDTLGDYPELKARGIHSGTENYGGAVVTAGGLLFIAATSDAKIRAFHKATGKLLWETDLPACGFATPAVYQVNGREFLVIACGGGKLKKASGDSYMAFALPAGTQ